MTTAVAWEHHPEDVHAGLVHAHNEIVAQQVIGDLQVSPVERQTSGRLLSAAIWVGIWHGSYMSGIGMISTISIQPPGIIWRWGWLLPNSFAAASWDCAWTIE